MRISSLLRFNKNFNFTRQISYAENKKVQVTNGCVSLSVHFFSLLFTCSKEGWWVWFSLMLRNEPTKMRKTWSCCSKIRLHTSGSFAFSKLSYIIFFSLSPKVLITQCLVVSRFVLVVSGYFRTISLSASFLHRANKNIFWQNKQVFSWIMIKFYNQWITSFSEISLWLFHWFRRVPNSYVHIRHNLRWRIFYTN